GVHSAARRMSQVHGPDVVRHPRYRDALVEVAVVSNAALAAHTLQQELTSADREVRAATAFYVTGERRIGAPRAGSADVDTLAYPPFTPAEFDAFAEAVVRSER